MRQLLTILTVVAVCFGLSLANGDINYRYWFDEEEGEAVTGTITQQTQTFEIDASSLTPNLHALHFQIIEDDTLMSAVHTSLFLRIAGGVGYEGIRYWFDQDMESGATVSGNAMTAEIDVSQLKPGLHTLNACTVGDSQSSTWSTTFFRTFGSGESEGIRYWFDENDSTAVEVPGLALATEIDVTDLKPGLHTIYACTIGEVPSSTWSTMFFRTFGNGESDALRYWFDEDEASAVVVPGLAMTREIDVSSLTEGIHEIHVQGIGTAHSVVASQLFVHSPKSSDLTVRTYFDDKPEYSTFTIKSGETKVLTLDVSGLPMGLHSLRANVHSNLKNVSSTYSTMFLRTNTDVERSKVRCYYSFDDFSMGFTEVPYSGNGTYQFHIDVADERLAEDQEHTLYCMLVLDDGTITEMHESTFYKNEVGDMVFNYPKVDSIDGESTETEILLSWQEVDLTDSWAQAREKYPELGDDEPFHLSGYNVYRDSMLINDAPLDAPAFSDTSFDVMKPHVYAVTATYDTGHETEYSDSYTSMYKVATPEITSTPGLITIKCSTPNAKIYYSVGTPDSDLDPIANGSAYENQPVEVGASCKIQAVAVLDGCFDSDVAVYNYDRGVYTVAAPAITIVDNIVTIDYADGAMVYYTTDGTMPEPGSKETSRYTNEFEVEHNCVVKAIAVKEGLFDSEVTEIVIDNFMAAAPVFAVGDDQKLSMSSSTPNAVIHYTVGGDEPDENSAVYKAPIALADKSLVKAKTYAEFFNPSPAASFDPAAYTCAAPVITVSDKAVVLSCDTKDVTIYYTLDGKTPTRESEVYSESFDLVENGTIKAIAVKSGMFDSDVAEKVIDLFQTPSPTFAVTDDQKLSLSCLKTDATIYYTTDGSTPTAESAKYTAPITVSKNTVVKAIATAENFNDSDCATYNCAEHVLSQPVINVNDSKVVITAVDGAVVYYTVNGDTPTRNSTKYTGEFEVAQNGTVKAFAVMSGWFDSDVAEKVIDLFQTPSPTFAVTDDQKLQLSCLKPDAAIYYTTDGSTPTTNSTRFTAAITVGSNATVKAFAVAPNFNASEVVTFKVSEHTCAIPEIKVNGPTVNITSATEGAEIRYTLDGTTPNGASMLYTQDFELEHNCQVNAIAIKKGMFNSAVSTVNVNAIKAKMPEFEALDGGRLRISTDTEGADIYYTIGGATPTVDSYRYTGVLTLTDNRVVKAIVVAPQFAQSDVATFTPDFAKCVAPQISYDGRYITIYCETDDATIYYTTDGTEPTDRSNVYTDRFDVKGNVTVRAKAVRQYFNDSDVATYSTPAYFDGSTVTIETPGSLETALGWIDKSQITELTITGHLNEADLAFIAQMKALEILIIEDVEIDVIGNYALSDMNLRYVSMPKKVNTVGSSIFANDFKLAAIKWNADIELTDNAVDGFDNPNLLVYVKDATLAPDQVRNVVINGHADEITLTDGSDFYCPERFNADHISYAHDYEYETALNGRTAGWESLTLPFDVQKVMHSDKGEIRPFALCNGDYTECKPFWLYQLDADGMTHAANIAANTPYLICMPNNKKYADDFILNGEVTFEAFNTYVPVTTANETSGGGLTFVPTVRALDKDENIYALNNAEYQYMGYLPGSIFVSDLRPVNPFEAYLVTNGTAMRAPYYDIAQLMGDVETGLPGLTVVDELWSVYAQGGVLYISTGYEQKVPLYNVKGTFVRMLELQPGVNTIGDLEQGVYIIKTDKIMIMR